MSASGPSGPLVCGFPGYKPVLPGWFKICVDFITGTPKAHRKWFYGEAGNRTCDPWFTRDSAYPLHHGGFSKKLFAAFPWVVTSTGPGGFMICVFII